MSDGTDKADKPKREKKPKKLSRSARWAAAVDKASTAKNDLLEAFEELRDIQSEYQDWLDNLPENLQNSALGEKLQTVCDLDLEDPDIDVIDEAESAELPQGYGRD